MKVLFMLVFFAASTVGFSYTLISAILHWIAGNPQFITTWVVCFALFVAVANAYITKAEL